MDAVIRDSRDYEYMAACMHVFDYVGRGTLETEIDKKQPLHLNNLDLTLKQPFWTIWEGRITAIQLSSENRER